MTTRIHRLIYADIQRVVEQRWAGGEADGEAEFKVTSAFVSRRALTGGRLRELGKEVPIFGTSDVVPTGMRGLMPLDQLGWRILPRNPRKSETQRSQCIRVRETKGSVMQRDSTPKVL